MLSLILILFALWVVLTLLMAAWTLWFQGYIYSEPVAEIHWRAPAAAAVVMAALSVWVGADYRTLGRFAPLTEFNYEEEGKRYEELRVPHPNGREEVFRLQRDDRGRPIYRSRDLRRLPLPMRPPEIIVQDNGERHVFKPDMDEKGHFKVRQNTSRLGVSRSAEPLLYRDDRGLVMDENYLGQLAPVYHVGWLILYLLLNLLLVVALFLAIWLLLRFQWSHALLQAIVFGGMLVLFVIPPVLTHTEEVARQRAAAAAAAAAAK